MAKAIEASPASSRAVLAATKVHIPPARPGHVPRGDLVDVLVAGAAGKLTLLDAPAGFGKTTLLAEWAGSPQETRRFAWLSLDEGDNDPVRFWGGLIDALRTVEPRAGRQVAGALRASTVGIVEVALPLLINDLTRLRRGVVLVLDDYHLIREAEVHRSIEFLLSHLPAPLHLAIATRSDPPLPLGRLRARGELTELRALQLRLTDEEGAALLRNAVGSPLEPEDVARLQGRAEGWAAGLYMAALSLRGRHDSRQFIRSFAGDDRHIVDYLSSEVLAGQPDELRAFLLHTSVLQRLCGPLCDAVTGSTGSVRILEQIERRNLFLIPLDSIRLWYRYHALFAELLRHELELREPGSAVELHRRAREWYRAEGLVADAIHHATAARDYDDARELIANHWNDFFNQGRLQTVNGWLEALPRQDVDRDPRLCVAGAWLALDRGRLGEAHDWIEGAEAGIAASDAGRLVQLDVSVLRAVHGFKVGDLGRANAAARLVLEREADESSFPRTVAHLILGVTHYWSGNADEAAAALEEAARLAEATANDLGRSYALGYLAMVAVDRGGLEAADRLGMTANGLSDDPGFREHFVTMMGHLARGRASEGRGQLEDAEAAIRRAEELSRRGAGRLETAGAQLALAQVRHARGDREDARERLREARRAIEDCADPGTLRSALERAERGLRVVSRGAAVRAAAPRDQLTDRELAVLRLLSTELTRAQIADALYVTPNTVKTHVRGIYRKLDASNREEVVARARELGLL